MSVRTISVGRSRRASADSASICRAANMSASRSTLKLCATFGRSTLTATRRRTPLVSISARCTWAIEAAATAGTEARIGLRSAGGRTPRRSPLRLRPAGTAACGPAGSPGRARAPCRPRRDGSPETGRASHSSGRDGGAPPKCGRSTCRSAAPRSGGRAAARIARPTAARPDRRCRTRRRARTHSLRGSAGRDGSALRSQTPARMQRDDAAAHDVPCRARESGLAHHGRRTRSAAGTGGSIRRGSGRIRRRPSPCARARG